MIFAAVGVGILDCCSTRRVGNNKNYEASDNASNCQRKVTLSPCPPTHVQPSPWPAAFQPPSPSGPVPRQPLGVHTLPHPALVRRDGYCNSCIHPEPWIVAVSKSSILQIVFSDPLSHARGCSQRLMIPTKIMIRDRQRNHSPMVGSPT